MGFLRRQQAKPAEPVTSHAVDLADSSDNESDSGSDASCSAPQSSTGTYNDKKTLRSSESDWTCTVQPSRRGFFLRASASIALPLPVEAAFGLFFGDNILPWRHFEECACLRLLEDDGAGRQALEVEQTVEFAFLHMHKTLRTRLAVTLDRPAGSMAFRLAAPGVLRRFEGRWRLLPAAAGSCQLLIEQEVHPKWAPRPLRRRMRYALIAFCEFMLREVRDEAARVAAGRPPAGPRACDGIRAAEAEGAAAAAPAPPAPQADKEHGKEGGGRRAAISLSAAAASTGGAGGDAPGPAPLKRSVTFAAGTRDAAGAVKGRPATAGHRRVRSITALCLVDGALGGGAPGGGDVLRAHSAPRLGRAASLPAQ